MKKTVRYVIGFLALLAFFLVLDSSGIGFRKHLDAIGNWAKGKQKHLHFSIAQK